MANIKGNTPPQKEEALKAYLLQCESAYATRTLGFALGGFILGYFFFGVMFGILVAGMTAFMVNRKNKEALVRDEAYLREKLNLPKE